MNSSAFGVTHTVSKAFGQIGLRAKQAIGLGNTTQSQVRPRTKKHRHKLRPIAQNGMQRIQYPGRQ